MTLIIVIQLLLHLFLTAKACTEIRVTTQDNSTVVIGPTPHSGTPGVFFTRSIYPLTAPILIMLMHHFLARVTISTYATGARAEMTH